VIEITAADPGAIEPTAGVIAYWLTLTTVPSGTASALPPLAAFAGAALGSGFLPAAAFGSTASSFCPLRRSSASFARSSLIFCFSSSLL
jgi:hypothetical protein